jgi:hypothetical protein
MIIQTTIEVYNRELDDMGIELPMEVKFSVDSNEICSVREHIEQGETKPSSNKCVIYLKSGESFVVSVNYVYVLYELKARDNT